MQLMEILEQKEIGSEVCLILITHVELSQRGIRRVGFKICRLMSPNILDFVAEFLFGYTAGYFCAGSIDQSMTVCARDAVT